MAPAGIIGLDRHGWANRRAPQASPAGTDRQELLDTFLQWCDALPLADGDADSVANGEDCEPGDASVWSRPSPAGTLYGVYGSPDQWNWSAPSAPGGSPVTYDLLRASDKTDLAGSTCVASDLAATTADDAVRPVSGELWLYYVRVNNACGENAGEATAGDRAAPSCTP